MSMLAQIHMKTLATTVWASGFRFLKSARWHDNRLWAADLCGQKVYRLNGAGAPEFVVSVPQRPTGLDFFTDGSLLVVSTQSRAVLLLKGGSLSLYCDLSGITAGELSDIVIDRCGRAYVTSFDWTARVPRCFRQARLVMITPDRRARVVASDFAFPNAAVITADQRHLIVAETFGRRLTEFTIDKDGSLSQRTILQQFKTINPDGICADAASGIWIAPMARPFIFRLDKGRMTHLVKLPGRQAVACALGGKSGDTLFCLTVPGNVVDIESRSASARVEIADLRPDLPNVSAQGPNGAAFRHKGA